jgi:hypothetical protein
MVDELGSEVLGKLDIEAMSLQTAQSKCSGFAVR